MCVLTHKLDEHQDASAIIVSHDMHLATTFADVIIKIRKKGCSKQYSNDEDIAYGFIDETCVFRPYENHMEWGNGKERYKEVDFEEYLRK